MRFLGCSFLEYPFFCSANYDLRHLEIIAEVKKMAVFRIEKTPLMYEQGR